MTMQNEEQAVMEEQPETEVQTYSLDDLPTDIIDTSAVQIEGRDAISAPTEPAPQVQEPPAPMPIPASPPPRDPELDALSQQNAALQQQVNQWNQWQSQQQMERQILEEANAARTQLANQGYPEDQIEVMVSQQQSFQRREAELQAEVKRRELHEQGRYRAAMHYAKQHGVDAESLLPYNSPQEMESRAREMGRIAQLEAKLSQYEKAQVPAQNFDSGTSQLSAVSNEEALIDRYNAGDRSPEALSAARRAAGL